MPLANQAQYDPNQILKPGQLVIGEQYRVYKVFNGEPTFLFQGSLKVINTNPEQSIVLINSDDMVDQHFNMYDLHIVPDKNGQWNASTFYLVRVPLLKS